MAIEILKDVWWVGVTDWGLRHFHGHELSTHRGSTYNAYVILGQKNVLVDTVWEPFSEEFMAELRSVIDPAKLDYVVANHAEPDHSGCLPAVMREAKNATLVVSRKGLESIPGHYHQAWNLKAVQTGDRLSLGERELIFVEAPMLHWPDSMFSYLTGANLLMPNDAFGQHYATAFRFNDEVDEGELLQEALKYYVNILTPFSAMVSKRIDEVLALNLPVDMIAPSHGVIWRKNPLQIVRKYQEWAQQVPEKRAVILYDSMWHATRRMAEAIGDGLREGGVDHKILYMALADRNDALVDVFRARMIILGSPTMNNGYLPSMAPILSEMKGLKFKNKLGAAFGSYGWSGESVKQLEAVLADTKVQVVHEGLSCKWQPDSAVLEKCRVFGRELAQLTLA